MPELLPLFRAYPRLAEKIPYESFPMLPSPAHRLNGLSSEAAAELYIKCDDAIGARYGGNKVRKLGFLLASARKDGVDTVLTFGAAGSNHALATAIYAREMGLRSISMMVPQPVAHSVRKNLLRGLAAGVEFHHYGGLSAVAMGTALVFAGRAARMAGFPRVIPTGGSSPVGILGFVNAAFELRDQVEAAIVPLPDAIYVASGTMGSAIGLLLGTQLAGLRIRIESVRVTAGKFTSMERGRQLFAGTNQLLHEAEPDIPLLQFPEERFTIREGFLGPQYALYTEEGMAAVRLAKALDHVTLEGTYTGKAMACLLDDARTGKLAGKRALFWNTYNSVDFADEIADLNYHNLPEAFHRYFEEEVQPLDR